MPRLRGSRRRKEGLDLGVQRLKGLRLGDLSVRGFAGFDGRRPEVTGLVPIRWLCGRS